MLLAEGGVTDVSLSATVGKPSKSFYQLALDSISSHGFERSEIGMIGKLSSFDIMLHER
jgi:ribonucleotide monophosphatase NagD (HAD superfamily)